MKIIKSISWIIGFSLMIGWGLRLVVKYII
jgi:hypothetical protein